jgi:hypothetical protein
MKQILANKTKVVTNAGGTAPPPAPMPKKKTKEAKKIKNKIISVDLSRATTSCWRVYVHTKLDVHVTGGLQTPVPPCVGKAKKSVYANPSLAALLRPKQKEKKKTKRKFND